MPENPVHFGQITHLMSEWHQQITLEILRFQIILVESSFVNGGMTCLVLVAQKSPTHIKRALQK